ncbi:1,4-dihydroxy-2-naphthoate polyprenyltransferase [bacterium]|nr:1,4-dihydroxy-2-naphthoate polyprenyltransferase [bacterium]
MLKNWVLAARLRTLPAAVAPVVLGAIIAYAAGRFNLLATLLAISGALAIQIGTNFANDYFDWRNGADTDRRLGPIRVTQSGLIPPQQVRAAMVGAFVVASAFGIGLIVRGGFPVLLIGVASIAMGILYTGGPKPLGYIGLGDSVAFLFFGPIATSATTYVNALYWDKNSCVLGIAMGFMTAAILSVNNMRDVEEDRLTGKCTLAVRFGIQTVRVEYALCTLGACGISGVWCVAAGRPWGGLVAGIVGAASIRLIRKMWSRTGRELDPLLGQTARLLLALAIGLSAAWIVG